MTVDQAVLDWLNTDPDWDLPDPGPDGPLAVDVTAPSAATLAEAGPAERREILFDYVCREVARSVGIAPADLDTERSLVGVGVGSMLGCELRYRLLDALGDAPELQEILTAESTRALASMLVDRLGYGG
ncbi:acyl carrier protein [Streptomyces sp. NPDC001744]|uniref:acyl carrier protein n=1 Tax=Streptomyces sp. NPDC001744 TaxID=3364606 RepID=UPI0036C09325